ncbi:MAG: GntR family transcriptional regulator [Acidimicrobiia bacterium]
MKDLGQTHNNLGDLVAAEIRAGILAGAFAPGEHLKQAKLAADLNVSRIPVREALRILESEGLIESTPGKGSRVIRITTKDAGEVLSVRGALEGLAARLASARVTHDDIEVLRATIADGLAATGREDHAAATEHHTKFHLELARASGNHLLFEELASMPAKTEWIHASLLQSRGPYSWTEHEAIVDAVARGDADLAERLVREHSETVARELSTTGASTEPD